MTDSNVNPSGKLRKCRISRGKKRYWKKGAKIHDAEDFLHEVQADSVEGVSSWKQTNDNLFTIDREPDPNNAKLTRRQMAALMKRLKKTEPVNEKDSVSKRELRKMLLKKSTKEGSGKANFSGSATIKARKAYDLWGEQCSLKETSMAEEYYLLATKNKLPQEPKTVKHITSILPHVEVAPAGASYNPSISKYLDYVTEVAEEEKRKIREENLEHQFAVPKEKYVTQEEIEMELTEGLNDKSDQISGGESEIELNDSEEKKPVMKPKVKQKTWKTLRSQRLEQKRKEVKKVSEFQKEQMHLVYSTRKLSKEISKEMRKKEELAEKRKEHKLIKRFAGTQRLGRGKFQPCEKSVLLAEELSGSLRELKPQGSILMERLNSLQKRNMLSIPGKKRQGKMKNRLLFKEREDRKHQEVKLGTRLI